MWSSPSSTGPTCVCWRRWLIPACPSLLVSKLMRGAFRWANGRARAIANPLVPPPSRHRHELNSDRKRLVTLSRLSSEKRPEFLVRSFASIARDHPAWDLEIYGDGPQRNMLEH